MSRKADNLDIIQTFITAEGRFNSVESKIMNDKTILSKNEIDKIMNDKTILSKNEIDKIIEQELKIPRNYIYEIYVY